MARFDQTHASSDGGALLLKALDERVGVTERVARSLTDGRQPGKVQHELVELVRQRIFGIACGCAVAAMRQPLVAVYGVAAHRHPFAA